MGRFEDLKEIAPCGMPIRYTVDTTTDFVTYNDINDRGENCYTAEKCRGCSWRALCRPTAPDFLKIITGAVGREVSPMEVIEQLFQRYGGAAQRKEEK